MKMDISQQPCSIRGREQTILKAASIWKVPCSLLDILRTFTWTRRSSTLIFSFWVNLQNKIFGEKVFCTDVENITQDNCFFLATSAIPFFIAELAGNAKKIFLPNVTASAKCIGLWEKDIPLSLSFLSESQSSHLTKLEAMEWFSNNIEQDSLFEKGWLAIAKLKPLSLFISLLSMPQKAFDNVKIEKWKVKVVSALQ